jgi:hypothetical protein
VPNTRRAAHRARLGAAIPTPARLDSRRGLGIAARRDEHGGPGLADLRGQVGRGRLKLQRRGLVHVRYRRARRTIQSRRVHIRRNCHYHLTSRIRHDGRLRVTARFGGNTRLLAARARAQTVSATPSKRP